MRRRGVIPAGQRSLAPAGAVLLLALTLSACSGDAPADASADAFCDALDGFSQDEYVAALQDEDYDRLADLFQEFAGRIADVGTPDDIPDDAREGFEIQVEAIEQIDADDLEEAFGAEAAGVDDPFTAGLSDEEQDKVDAFTSYQADACADVEAPGETPVEEMPTTATDLPTEMTTELPSELPSEVPTEVPSELESMASEFSSHVADLLTAVPTEAPSE